MGQSLYLQCFSLEIYTEYHCGPEIFLQDDYRFRNDIKITNGQLIKTKKNNFVANGRRWEFWKYPDYFSFTAFDKWFYEKTKKFFYSNQDIVFELLIRKLIRDLILKNKNKLILAFLSIIFQIFLKTFKKKNKNNIIIT